MKNEQRLNYKVLNPIGFGGERCNRGSIVSMYPSEASSIGSDYVELVDSSEESDENIDVTNDAQDTETITKPVKSIGKKK